MAASSGENSEKSPENFEYCDVCRISHTKGKKHLYSKTHREKIKFVLHRFGEKVKLAKEDIAAPCILAGSQDTESSYWCYMCKTEVIKHVSDGQVTIRNAAFIEHLKSADHLVNTDKFWKDYCLDRVLKLQYVLTQEEFCAFKPALEKALDAFEEEDHRELAQRAAEIRKSEAERRKVADVHSGGSTSVLSATETPCNHDNRGGHEQGPGCSQWNSGPHQAPKTNASDVSPWQRNNHNNPSVVPISRKATSSVLDSGGLTSIGVQVLKAGEGNIHTGATPPWMMRDEDDNTNHMLGPSLDDYNKHLERERKRKLNPNRVGANFDHVTATRDEWLPSFGRVWNQGRRWQSRHQFKKETGLTTSKRRRPNTMNKEGKPPATQSKPP
ncbi:centrosomal AT-AC splicing factor-like [Amphiura filiformis]|uniref:centrosomal AT-AC splicing factor-like n=1 Tax=Amphiura filiformis TaxID=82378 RepID=UPI003B215445